MLVLSGLDLYNVCQAVNMKNGMQFDKLILQTFKYKIMSKTAGNSNQSGSKGTGSGKGSSNTSTNPQYPSTTGKPSGGGRGNSPKGK